jgi:hypothetical protein
MRYELLCITAAFVAAGCGGTVESDQDATDDTIEPDVSSDGVADTSDDPAPDAAVDPEHESPDECIHLIVEAESFELNEWWAACPGSGCEDDQSGAASGGGHLITFEGHTTDGPEGYLSMDVDLPRTGTWYVWARSARAGPGREWDFALDGTVSAGVIGSAEAVWESGGEFEATRTNATLVVRDAAPDAYWAYPDALVFSVSDTFDPNDCAVDGIDVTGCLCD